MRKFMRSLTNVSQFHTTIRDLFGAEGRVAVRLSREVTCWTGGPRQARGLPAPTKTIMWDAIAIVRFEGTQKLLKSGFTGRPCRRSSRSPPCCRRTRRDAASRELMPRRLHTARLGVESTSSDRESVGQRGDVRPYPVDAHDAATRVEQGVNCAPRTEALGNSSAGTGGLDHGHSSNKR